MSFQFSSLGSPKVLGIVALGFLAPFSAHAVVFSDGNVNTTQNTTAPGTAFNNQIFDQALPWYNVGQITTSSAIYLGDIGGNGKYWVLSVHHGTGNGPLNGVQPATARFQLPGSPSQVDYNTVPNTMVHLTDSGGGLVDLIVFQLAAPLPGLPTLGLQTTALTHSASPTDTSDDLYYVGYGNNTKRWGFNNYERTEFREGDLLNGNGISLVTEMNTGTGNANESQLINGDSGGAAFYYDASAHLWKVAGVLYDAAGTSGANGELSFSISMPDYGMRVLAAVPEPGSVGLVAMGLAGITGSYRRRRGSLR